MEVKACQVEILRIFIMQNYGGFLSCLQSILSVYFIAFVNSIFVFPLLFDILD